MLAASIPFDDIFFAKILSLKTERMFWVSISISSNLYSNPVSPSTTISGTPPTKEAINGTPRSCASPKEFGLFSMLDGQIKTCAFCYS